MFQVEADHLICTLWDTLRPRSPVREYPDYKSSGCDRVSEPGLITTLDLRLSVYLDSKTYDASALVHTLFTSNTSVFVAVTQDFQRWSDVKIEDFHNTSNHDSCWRSDGMSDLRKLYYSMRADVLKELMADGHSISEHTAFHQFSTLGALGSKPWEFVKVTHSVASRLQRSGIHHPYRRELHSIEKEEKHVEA